MKSKLDEIVKSKKIGLIIFTRISSKRFPGKVLSKIYKDQNIIDIIINKLKKIKDIFIKFSKIKKILRLIIF